MTMCMAQCTMPVEEEINETVLTDEIASHLQFMREEEYLAHDVYLYLYAEYQLLPFENIRKSEFRHTEAVKTLLNSYDIVDPAAEHQAGIFQDEAIQELYNTLTEQGDQSLEEALRVGLLIEEKDIYDLDEALKMTDEDSDISFVLSNLKRASGNHLRAFHFNFTSRAGDYTPVILEEAYFEEILNQ